MPLYELDELARGIRRRLKSPKGKSVLVPIKFLERALTIIEKAVDELEGKGKEEISHELEQMELESRKIFPVRGDVKRGRVNEKTAKKEVTQRRIQRIRA